MKGYQSGVYSLCKKIAHAIIQKICRETTAHKHSFNTFGSFVHDSVRACVGSFQKLIHKILYNPMERNWTSGYTDLYA